MMFTRLRKWEQPAFYKGGGSQPMPQQATPQQEAEARQWEAEQEAIRAEKARVAEEARKAAEKADAITKWKGNKTTAKSNATSYGTGRMTAYGLGTDDPYGLWTAYQAALDRADTGLAELADPTAAFGNSVFDEAAGTVRTGVKNQYENAIEDALGTHYAEDTFGSTIDDPYLDAILSTQYGDATADLEASRDRGVLNTTAFDRAVKNLGTAKAGANSELQGIGGGILSGYSDTIGGRITDLYNDVSDWDFGDTFNATDETGRVKNKANELLGQLSGDISTAVGDREFFDVDKYIGKANARVGGATAKPTTGTTTTFDDQEQDDNEEGVF